MKVAYVLYPEAIISGNSNGIKSQALTWKKGLEERKHTVTEINLWGNYNWKEFDIIHIFGTGLWLNSFVKGLYKKNTNIVISPIIDSIQSKFNYKLSAFMGIEKFRLWSPTFTLKKTLPFLKAVFVRSDYESLFFSDSMQLTPFKIFKVPLSFEETICNDGSMNYEKEDFCLHISSIYQERKNVLRLIRAAKKFNFNLVLAGSKGTEVQFKKIKKEIGDAKNIQVLGFISEDEMKELFLKAKVFALPSISEGVGIVALNAAKLGCEIVITNIGGPKEYYNNMAMEVNPYSVDEIGNAIIRLLVGEVSFQPKLKEFIKQGYSELAVINNLEKCYNKILKNE